MSESDKESRPVQRGSLWRVVVELALLLIVSFVASLSALVGLSKARPLSTGPTAYSLVVKPKETPPTIIRNTVKPTFSVYFNNGKHDLTPSAADLLARLKAVTNCEAASIKITPWVSSIAFAGDPGQARNLKLARDRGRAVRSFLERRPGVPAIEEKQWSDFGELAGALTYRDLRAMRTQATPEEALNRRVDIDLVSLCSR